jgi:hypothetical protein
MGRPRQQLARRLCSLSHALQQTYAALLLLCSGARPGANRRPHGHLGLNHRSGHLVSGPQPRPAAAQRFAPGADLTGGHVAPLPPMRLPPPDPAQAAATSASAIPPKSSDPTVGVHQVKTTAAACGCRRADRSILESALEAAGLSEELSGGCLAPPGPPPPAT